MALVGKKFPNITVDAISHMGDNLRINVLEEAVNNKKKVLLVKHCKRQWWN
jgi:peroxiredoxin 2/4